MISGLVSTLDPHINPWRQIERYGQQLLRGQSFQQFRDMRLAGVVELLRPFLDTPARIQRLLEEAEKGRLRVLSLIHICSRTSAARGKPIHALWARAVMPPRRMRRGPDGAGGEPEVGAVIVTGNSCG